MSEREQRVREIAHRLWEEEGRPSDQEKRHWTTAEQMFDAEETAGPGAPPASAAGTRRRTSRKGATRTPAATQTSASRPH